MLRNVQRWVLIILILGMAVILTILATGKGYSQSNPVKVGSVYYVIDDSTKQASFFQVFEAQGCPANIYVHDTMWQIPGGFTTTQPTYPVVPQYVFIHDTIYLPVTQPSYTTIYTTQTLPTTSATDGKALTVGVQFQVSQPGFIKAIRFYKTVNNTGTHTGTLYGSSGSVLGSGTFTSETATGWQSLAMSVPVQPGTTYTAAYYSPTGQYSSITGAFTSPIINGAVKGMKGVYVYGNGLPSLTYNNSGYFVDIIFSNVP